MLGPPSSHGERGRVRRGVNPPKRKAFLIKETDTITIVLKAGTTPGKKARIIAVKGSRLEKPIPTYWSSREIYNQHLI